MKMYLNACVYEEYAEMKMYLNACVYEEYAEMTGKLKK